MTTVDSGRHRLEVSIAAHAGMSNERIHNDDETQ